MHIVANRSPATSSSSLFSFVHRTFSLPVELASGLSSLFPSIVRLPPSSRLVAFRTLRPLDLLSCLPLSFSLSLSVPLLPSFSALFLLPVTPESPIYALYFSRGGDSRQCALAYASQGAYYCTALLPFSLVSSPFSGTQSVRKFRGRLRRRTARGSANYLPGRMKLHTAKRPVLTTLALLVRVMRATDKRNTKT